MVKIRFICFILLLSLNVSGHTQSLVRSVISITGNSSNDNEGQLTYTAGEVITGSFFVQVNSVTQGFQQPSLLNLADDPTSGINAVEVYPNPVLRDLTILFNIRSSKLLKMDLLSANGVIIQQEQFSVSESGWIDVNMENYPCGLYLLHLYSTDLQIDRLFKIEKM